jgi:hypothetical protein
VCTNAPSTTVTSSAHTQRSSNNDHLSEDRITLRLRAGDRAQISERVHPAMKPGSELAMLIDNHVHGLVMLPPNELAQIKATCAQLAALGRRFRMFGLSNSVRSALE